MIEAGVVILRRYDGAILMQHRDNIPTIKFPGHWGLPGGRTESEHPRRTAIRELKEETGYCLNEGDLVLIGQGVQQIGEALVWRSFYLAFYDGKQEIQCNEGQGMEFVHPRDFAGRKITADHINFIKIAEEKIVARSKERR